MNKFTLFLVLVLALAVFSVTGCSKSSSSSPSSSATATAVPSGPHSISITAEIVTTKTNSDSFVGVTVYDETAGAAITNATVVINGVTYPYNATYSSYPADLQGGSVIVSGPVSVSVTTSVTTGTAGASSTMPASGAGFSLTQITGAITGSYLMLEHL